MDEEVMDDIRFFDGEPPPWGALAYSAIGILGLGWGGLALFGYHLDFAGLADAPGWLTILSFLAMPVGGLFLGFILGDGSVVEVVLKTALAGFGFWILSGLSGLLDPILLAVGCGFAAMVVTGVSARLLGIEDHAEEN